MNTEIFSRSEALLGAERMERLRTIRVIIFGVGGVGSACAEALVRTGLTHLTIVDYDRVQASNLNRQIMATAATIGQAKVQVLRERLLSINPEAEIIAREEKVDGEWLRENGLDNYDFIVDAIDDVSAKTDLIYRATRTRGVKIVCSMGAALRLDPTQVRVAELFDVKGDALAKAVRARLKRLNLKLNKKVRCVYSLEQAQLCSERGSIMPVTTVFGCTLAAMVIKG